MAEPATIPAPVVSVVMPVHNGGPYLAASIQCILDQTFSDFEFIIVDDGSTDDSNAVIRSFDDPRIRLITQANQGLAAALNAGLAQARGEWIARQDADDISLPERLAKQLAFLCANATVGLLGTWAIVTDSTGAPIKALEHPVTDEEIQYAVLFDSPFVHSSVMGARALFEAVGGYDTAPGLFEDLDMWGRVLQHTRGANLPEHLVRYREVGTSFSRSVTNWNQRLFEQRRLNMRAAFPLTADDLLNSMAELGLRNAAIPRSHFVQVRSLLATHIHDTVRAPSIAKKLRAHLRRSMRGYRLIPHRTLVHRAADRFLKELLLLWPHPRQAAG